MTRIHILLCCMILLLTLSAGAQTWEILPSPTTAGLRDLEFADIQHGGVLCSNQEIGTPQAWLTADGGMNWTGPFEFPHTSAISVPVYPHVYILGFDTMYVATLWHSSDWGTSWGVAWTGSTGNYADMDFYDARNGIIVGSAYVGGWDSVFVVQTADGGASWNSTFAPGRVLGTMYACEMNGPTNGIIGGSVLDTMTYFSTGTVFTFVRGFWRTNRTFPGIGAITNVDAANFTDVEYMFTCDSTWGFYSNSDGSWTTGFRPGEWLLAPGMSANHNRWFVGQDGLIGHQGPGDAAWTVTTGTPVTQSLRAVDFVNARHGWASGDNGTIIRYTEDFTFVPSPMYPTCGSDVTDNPLVLFWTNSGSDPSYRVQVAIDPDFTELVLDHIVIPNVDSLWSWSTGTYWWRVRVEEAGVFGPWMDGCSFNYRSGEVIRLVTPDCGGTLDNESFSFVWTPAGWDSWDLLVNFVPNVGSPVSQEFDLLADTVFLYPFALGDGMGSWQVRGHMVGGPTGAWTDVCAFAIAQPHLPAPTLTAPGCGATYPNDLIRYSWNTVPLAMGYEYQIDSLESFPAPIVDEPWWFDTTTTWVPAPLVGPVCFRVRAIGPTTGEYGMWSDACCITLEPALYPPPRPLAPECDSWGFQTSVTFIWNNIGTIATYHLQISDDSLFSAPYVDEWGLPDTQYTAAVSAMQVFWRIQGQFAENLTEWSNVCKLTRPNIPRARTPACGDTLRTESVTLGWSSAGTTALYHVQIDDNTDFSSPWFDADTFTTTGAVLPIPPIGRWFWRVRAYWGANTTPWGPNCNFIIPALRTPPVLYSPYCGQVISYLPMHFEVMPGSGFTRYQIQVAGESTFTATFFDTTYNAMSYNIAEIPNGHWFWRARGFTSLGEPSAWSAACGFDVDIVVPLVPPIPFIPGCGDTVTSLPVQLVWHPGDSRFNLFRLHVGQVSPPEPPYLINTMTSDTTYTLATLTPGTYYWSVMGIVRGEDSSSFSTTCSFVYVIPPTVPQTLQPLCDHVYTAPPLLAVWTRIPGVMGYDVQFADNVDFTAPWLEQSITGDMDTTLAISAHTGRTYWRVRAAWATHMGDWSHPCAYDVGTVTLYPPYLIYPYCGGTCNDSIVTFYWECEEGVTYDLQVSLEMGFESPIYSVDGLTTCWQNLPLDLPWGQMIYWQVRAVAPTGEPSVWSVCRFMHERRTPPVPPGLISPICGDTLTGDSLTFTWHSVPGAVNYEFQILMGAFEPGADGYSSIFLSDTSYRVPAPTGNYAFVWRVRTWTRSQAVSEWSDWCRFSYEVGQEPQVPSVLQPACGSVNSDTAVTFIWNSSPGAHGYRFEAYSDTLFTAPIRIFETYDTFYTMPYRIMTGFVYWHVRAIRYSTMTAFSEWCMFFREETDVPPPVPNGEACETVVSDSVVHLNWSYSGPPGLFQVQLSTDSTFAGGFSRYYNGIAALNYDIYGLGDGSYYWRVRISHYQRVSEWSDYCSFEIRGLGLGRPITTRPECGDSVFGAPLVFSWLGLAVADSYIVQMSRRSDFGSPLNLPATTGLYLTCPRSDTLSAGMIYWRVRAFAGRSASSSRICSFDWLPGGGAPLTPLRPFCRSTVSGSDVHFVWMPAARAIYYLFHLMGDGWLYNASTPIPAYDFTISFPGVYTWTIQAVDSSGVPGPTSTPCSLRVMGSSPRLPGTVILYPENEVNYLRAPSQVIWRRVPTAEAYEVELDDDEAFSLPLTASGYPTDTTWAIPPGTLITGRNYYVRVRGTANVDGSPRTGPWSTIVSFRVSDIILPPIRIAILLDTLRTLPACLHWTPVFPNCDYNLRFGRDDAFTDLIFTIDRFGDTLYCLADSTIPMSLPLDTVISWSVSYFLPGIAHGADWSDPGHIYFPSHDIYLGPDVHLYDLNCHRYVTASESDDTGILVSWVRDTTVHRYRFQASFASNFSTTALNLTTPDTTFLFRPSDFDNNVPTLLWRVRSENPGAMPGTWSRVCDVSRVIQLDMPIGIWGRECGDTALINTWPPPQATGFAILYGGNASGVRYQVETVSDDGGAPIAIDEQASLIYRREWSWQPNGWTKWRFNIRVLPPLGSEQYMESEAYACSLWHSSLPPVVLYAAANAESTVQVVWFYLAQTANQFKILRTQDLAVAYTQVGTTDGTASSWQDLTARAHTSYYYKVQAANTHFGVNASLWTSDAFVRSTFLPLRDGQNYCNCGSTVFTGGAGTWPTWDIVVRAFGHDNTYNDWTGQPRFWADFYWRSHRSNWGGSCMGFSATAQMMAERFGPGFTLFGATYYSPTSTFWDGGTITGRLHQLSIASPITSEMTATINAIQVGTGTYNWGAYDPLYNHGFNSVWSHLNGPSLHWAEQKWVIAVWWVAGGAHQVVPYKVATVGSKRRIYVYDENSPNDGTLYMEHDPSRSGADTLRYGGALSIIQIAPVSIWHHVPNPPFSTAGRFSRPAGPENFPATGDSLQLIVIGAAHPLIVNTAPESLGWSGGWFDRMVEGHVAQPPVVPDTTWEGFTYILNPDSFRVSLYNSTGVDSFYKVIFMRPGGFIIFDSIQIGAGQTDQLWLGASGEEVRFRPETDRPFRITAYRTNETWQEIAFQVYTTVAGGDSVGFGLFGPMGDTLRFTNWGSPTTYDANLIRDWTEHINAPLRNDMPIGSGYTHWITPGTWAGIDTTCIYVAEDNTGDLRIDTVFCATSGVEERRAGRIGRFEILSAEPNPASNICVVEFTNPRVQALTISLYDIDGHDLGVLSDLVTPAGKQAYYWFIPENGLPNGVYFMRFQAGAEERVLRVAVRR